MSDADDRPDADQMRDLRSWAVEHTLDYTAKVNGGRAVASHILLSAAAELVAFVVDGTVPPA